MTVKPKILIIEDEPNIASFMSTILSANDYAVLRAANGADGLMMASSHCPEVILLDLGLPDMDGKEIIRLGADDYVTKPFGTSELLARVRTALRHARTSSLDGTMAQTGKFTAGPLVVDFDKRHVYVDGRDAKLTQNEFRIVALLAKHAGRVLTYDMLLKAVWGPNGSSDNQILRVNMANIRRKIEENPGKPQFIFTEMGVGYRMVEGD